MIGQIVLAPMRKVPLAYTYGHVARVWTDGRVEVNMPHKGVQLAQAFRPDELLWIQENLGIPVAKQSTYDQFHELSHRRQKQRLAA